MISKPLKLILGLFDPNITRITETHKAYNHKDYAITIKLVDLEKNKCPINKENLVLMQLLIVLFCSLIQMYGSIFC